MSKQNIDEISGVETTGHEWDGIKELNNPLPRWWVWTFYVTIVWAIAYTVAYPAWPMLKSATSGVLGFSSRQMLSQDLKAAAAAHASESAAIAQKPLAEIMADENLRRYAEAAGGAAFKVNCIQCHGSGAQGGVGYPNLNDDDWLWGGDIETVHQTISHGVRFATDDETRISEMPAFGDILDAGQIKQVAAYVVSLSGTPRDAAQAQAGAQIFADNCAACHGADGKGGREFGAPNLTDAIWLYKAGEDAVASQVRAPRHGIMPAWSARLNETTVKELAVYVHSLGGGE